ncbi:uncharacterized protein TM35_000132510 [Trypanosoma theileri]|uniref:Uncharacterized protein n=1 Tax=Trypanosoma theileri TaxID=67003 RepID=A0A1X0NX21_9TRYP|nr:uncharacterized protein TM35_000132510 [Trypanosoma theileri]ORC89247.1 hypothetical protein TM35_000132510 [Trypanosoma theileri]
MPDCVEPTTSSTQGTNGGRMALPLFSSVAYFINLLRLVLPMAGGGVLSDYLWNGLFIPLSPSPFSFSCFPFSLTTPLGAWRETAGVTLHTPYSLMSAVVLDAFVFPIAGKLEVDTRTTVPRDLEAAKCIFCQG